MLDKIKTHELFGLKQILLLTFVVIISITINNVYGDAVCPKDTIWDGENCVYIDTRVPITFTDYLGNPVHKFRSDKSEDDKMSEIIITRLPHEILADLMIVKPEIKEIQDMRGKALEQKILYDQNVPTNITRDNYHFNQIKEYTTNTANDVFNKIVFGKQIQNPDFGVNNEHQIEYAKRYERSEDPVLQNQIIQENQRAQQTFLENWGNFTNY